MKAKIIPMLLCLAMLLGSCTKKKSDLEKANLQGKVQKIVENTYLAFEYLGELQEGKLLSGLIVTYNESGNLLEEARYNANGELWWTEIYKYDDKGNKIEKTIYYNGKLDRTVTYKNDIQGNQTEETRYNANGKLIEKNSYEYGTEGNPIEYAIYNSDGNSKGRYTYEYNDQGNQTEEAKYYADGKLAWKETYKYSDLGYKIEEARYDADGKLGWKHTYQYEQCDKKGNWTKRICKIEVKDNKVTQIITREISYY